MMRGRRCVAAGGLGAVLAVVLAGCGGQQERADRRAAATAERVTSYLQTSVAHPGVRPATQLDRVARWLEQPSDDEWHEAAYPLASDSGEVRIAFVAQERGTLFEGPETGRAVVCVRYRADVALGLLAAHVPCPQGLADGP